MRYFVDYLRAGFGLLLRVAGHVRPWLYGALRGARQRAKTWLAGALNWWKYHDSPLLRRRLITIGILALVCVGAVTMHNWRARSTSGPPPPQDYPPYINRPGGRRSVMRDGDLDVIIRGGTVIDGTGAPRFVADVGILGGRIAAIGDLSGLRASREISAQGLFVAPGFVNTHSHTYETIMDNPDATSSLMQGITLEVGGVDGRSPVDLETHFSRVMARGTGVNYAMYVGQGSVRQRVIGAVSRSPTYQELAEMKVLVRRAILDGAFGLSTGLEYVSGKYTQAAELVELGKAAAAAGGPGTLYSTHMRSEGTRIVEAVEEALDIARESGLTLKISHLKIVYSANWPKAGQVLELLDEARLAGVPVWADVYPYLAPDYSANVLVADVSVPVDPGSIIVRFSRVDEWLGRSLSDIAALLGVSPEDALRVVVARDPGVRVVREIISEPVMERFLAAPWAVLTNDASARPWYNDYARASGLHPRTYGAFPRFLGYYVRDRALMTWEQGINMVTGRPAELLGLTDRGLIAEGYHADLVVLSPEGLQDTATYVNPQSYPRGIRYVYVNGMCVVEKGRRIEGVRPGQIVRRKPPS